MKFIKYADYQIINLSNIISIGINDLGTSIEFDCVDNCFYWKFQSKEETTFVYGSILKLIQNRFDALAEIPHWSTTYSK